MKSAYELAMERLEKDSPDSVVKLSDEQRKQLEEIDQKFRAKVAEKEVFLQRQILEARRSRDREALEQLEKQLRNEKARLEDERERAKEKVRQSAQ